ncbi:unnamed protein product [Caenorhabditis auriculariae]|uniref:DUF19 domain-containing protein n=1 Tax=Caenorhabditis auriculariae TaxID=2777116 RepID=A0A8S1HRT0_9PELO|nr:unnamed protein product [Caenorhabditis auriculariae]
MNPLSLSFILVTFLSIEFCRTENFPKLNIYETVRNVKDCLDEIDHKEKNPCEDETGDQREKCAAEFAKNTFPRIKSCIDRKVQLQRQKSEL